MGSVGYGEAEQLLGVFEYKDRLYYIDNDVLYYFEYYDTTHRELIGLHAESELEYTCHCADAWAMHHYDTYACYDSDCSVGNHTSFINVDYIDVTDKDDDDWKFEWL